MDADEILKLTEYVNDFLFRDPLPQGEQCQKLFQNLKIELVKAPPAVLDLTAQVGGRRDHRVAENALVDRIGVEKPCPDGEVVLQAALPVLPVRHIFPNILCQPLGTLVYPGEKQSVLRLKDSGIRCPWKYPERRKLC